MLACPSKFAVASKRSSTKTWAPGGALKILSAGTDGLMISGRTSIVKVFSDGLRFDPEVGFQTKELEEVAVDERLARDEPFPFAGDTFSSCTCLCGFVAGRPGAELSGSDFGEGACARH